MRCRHNNGAQQTDVIQVLLQQSYVLVIGGTVMHKGW